jgi:tetratricopeptide (TPR) repeat protein
VDKHEREQLKHDVFVDEVKHGLDYAVTHKPQLARWGALAAGLVAIVLAWFWWSGKQAEQRMADLRDALTIQQAAVGQGSNPYLKSYPAQADKTAALRKELNGLAAKYPSKEEGAIAHYYLGVSYADEGNYGEAEKHWQKVVDGGSKEYGSLGRYSLAQLYAQTGKQPQAEQLLRYLVEHPTTLVSAENAKIELAKLVARSKPEEAQKLLDPLRQMTTRNAVSRWAITAYSETRKASK